MFKYYLMASIGYVMAALILCWHVMTVDLQLQHKLLNFATLQDNNNAQIVETLNKLGTKVAELEKAIPIKK